MRLVTAKCILLACIVTTLATDGPRSKRDLQFLKEVLAAKLGLTAKPQREESVKILRLADSNQVFLRAVPKITVVDVPLSTKLVQVPEKIVEVPERIEKVPEKVIQIPERIEKVPERVIQLPERIEKVPERVIQEKVVQEPERQIVETTETIEKVPERIVKVTERIIQAPERIIQVPERIMQVPERFMQMPERFMQMPERFMQVPERIVQVQPSAYESFMRVPEPMWPFEYMTGRQNVIQVAPPKPPVFMVNPVMHRYSEPQQFVTLYDNQYPVMPPLPEQYPMPQVQFLPPFPSFGPIPFYPQGPILPPPQQELISLPAQKIYIPEPKPVTVQPLQVTVPIKPIVPIKPTTYSYRQGHADGSHTSYISEGSQDVVVISNNQPPPPPPPFILDRFQKIIYRMPLGSPAPVKTESGVVVGPFPEAGLSVVKTPAQVEVTKPNKYSYKGSLDVFDTMTAVKKPDTATLVKEEFVVPEQPPVLIESQEDPNSDLYKHYHEEGDYSTAFGSYEPSEMVSFDHISKLPPPPQELIERIEAMSGKPFDNNSMWGYSLKMANGVGSYETLGGDKIYYSRLQSPPKSESPGYPDPLSTFNDEEKDEFGRPFISTKIDGRPASNEITYKTQDESGRFKIEAIKKYPPLPMPMVGENEKKNYDNDMGSAKYSYTVNNYPDGTKYIFSAETPTPGFGDKKYDHNRFGSDGFSYTQVNHDGSVETFDGTGKYTTSAITGKTVAWPSSNPTTHVEDGEMHPSGFSYTQIEKGGSATKISGDGNVKTINPILVEEVKVPVKPVQVPNCVHKKSCVHKVPTVAVEVGNQIPGYSYAQIDGKPYKVYGELTSVPAIPGRPAGIIDVIQHGPGFSYTQINNGGMMPAVKVSQQPTAVLDVIQSLEKHPSAYSYTQINNAGDAVKITGDGEASNLVVPARPSAVVDVIQPFEKHRSGYSYTQITNGGGVHTITGDGQVLDAAPVAVVDVVQPVVKPGFHYSQSVTKTTEGKENIPVIPVQAASVVDVVEPIWKRPGYSYTQISNNGGVHTISGVGHVSEIPVVQPSAVVDVIQPLVKNTPGFSYTQINSGGVVTKITGDGKVQAPVVTEVVVPKKSENVVAVSSPVKTVTVAENPGTVMFAEPVASSYVYKQISHTNPQPFTVVRVGDTPMIEAPLGEVQVKVNKHEHVRADGTTYPCTEYHEIPSPDAIPSPPTSGATTIPVDYMYVPPTDGNGLLPSSHKEKKNAEFSTQVPTTTIEVTLDKDKNASDNPNSLSLNPIVVADEDYSYTVKNTDGSKMTVHTDKNNSVSVNVENAESMSSTEEPRRGDM